MLEEYGKAMTNVARTYEAEIRELSRTEICAETMLKEAKSSSENLIPKLDHKVLNTPYVDGKVAEHAVKSIHGTLYQKSMDRLGKCGEGYLGSIDKLWNGEGGLGHIRDKLVAYVTEREFDAYMPLHTAVIRHRYLRDTSLEEEWWLEAAPLAVFAAYFGAPPDIQLDCQILEEQRLVLYARLEDDRRSLQTKAKEYAESGPKDFAVLSDFRKSLEGCQERAQLHVDRARDLKRLTICDEDCAGMWGQAQPQECVLSDTYDALERWKKRFEE